MRPVELTLQGLHSFKNRQVVDFSKLLDAGVFGIFGPTGAGKSTILDAITLSLYGTVERAPNKTSGILNQSSESVEVSFVFELGQGNQRSRYKVERVYKRKSEFSLENKISRLSEILDIANPTDSARVIADKQGDVNNHIVKIIGLSMEDFTRAVVLPQGKFAEFLKLVGSDRNKMLQRLFNLEACGEQLTKKVRAEKDATQKNRTNVESEQTGLGNASAEILAHALQNSLEFKNELNTVKKNLSEFLSARDNAKKYFKLVLELSETQFRIADLVKSESECENSKEKIRTARLAGSVFPSLEKYKQWLREIPQLETAVAELSQKFRHAEKTASQANETLAVFQIEHGKTLNFTAERKKEIEFVKEAEAELFLTREKFRICKGIVTKLAGEEDTCTKEIATVEAQLNQAVESVKGFERTIDTNSVSMSDKQNILTLMQSVKDYRNASQAREKLLARSEQTKPFISVASEKVRVSEAALLESKEAYTKFEASKAELVLQPCLDPDVLTAATYKLSLIKEYLSQEKDHARKILILQTNVDKKSAEFKEAHALFDNIILQQNAFLDKRIALKETLQMSENAQRETEKQNLALVLAVELSHGAPCPVCGSTEHPLVAKPSGTSSILDIARSISEFRSSLDANDSDLENLRKKEVLAQSKISEAQEQKKALEAQYLDISHRLSDLQKKSLALFDEIKVQLDTPDLSTLTEFSSETVQVLERSTQEKIAAIKSRTTNLEKIQREMEKLSKKKSLQEEEVSLKKNESTKYQAEKDFVEHALAETEVQLKTIETIFQQKSGGLNFEQVEHKSAALLVREGLVADAMNAAKPARERVALFDQTLAALRTNAADLKANLLSQKHQSESLLSLGVELADKVKAKTGNQKCSDILLELELSLKTSTENLAVLSRENERATQTLSSLQVELAVTEQKRNNAVESAHNLALDVERLFAQTGLRRDIPIGTMLLSEAEVSTIENQIAEHIKQAGLARERKELVEAEIALCTVPNAELPVLENQLRDAEVRQLEVSKKLGAAEQELQTLRGKHERWQTLERERCALEAREGLLIELDSVTKGGAFVKFLAEEQLRHIARDASIRLGSLTRQRYALTLDSSGGFCIKDLGNAGSIRPVSTLSGGETFLTSLALALSLSTQIQLRGQFPLEFFFLDEGFGTLDPDLLETVINSLESLRLENLNIGVISHVPELRSRLNRQLIVEPGTNLGQGSTVRHEVL